MPFDFDVAMGVLEKLKPEERAAVLNALGVIVGPTKNKKVQLGRVFGIPVHCVWGLAAENLTVEHVSAVLPDEIKIVDRRRQVIQQFERVLKVTFTCEAKQLYGMRLLAHAPIQESEDQKKIRRQFTALDSLTASRKERNVL
jgi:hypothetical protein